MTANIGFRLDRASIPQLALLDQSARLAFQREASGLRVLLERAVYGTYTQAENPTFAGTKTDCAVVVDLLTSDSPTFWGSDPSTFWGADGSVFWNLAKAWVYQFSVTPPAATVGNAMRVAYIVFGGASITVEYRAAAGPWTAYDDTTGVTVAAATTYDFRLTAADVPETNGLVALSAYVAVPARVERVNGFAVAAAGTRLPIASAYNEINQVTFEVQPYSAAVSASAIDLDPTLGPLVQCFNSLGAAVFGVVNATIIGY